MGLLDELMGWRGAVAGLPRLHGPLQPGSPYEGISDDDAVNRYGQVAGEVDPDTYRESTRDAFANMAPEEREQYAQQLGSVADQQESVTVGTGSPPTQTPSPRSPATCTSRAPTC